MTLFFVDNNIYKEPAELLDNYKDSYFQIGDYCLLKSGESTYKFIAITKPLETAKKWDIYPVLDSIHVAGVTINTKIILFSYEASIGRKGNIKDLSKLMALIHISEIKNLIKNSIDILSYKTDRWDANILISIIQLTNKIANTKVKEKRIKKSESNLDGIPFFTVVAGESLPWLTIKRFENLNVSKNTPVSYLLRTSLISNDVFSFCSSNELVYLIDIVNAYNKYANFTSLKGDSLAIEESLKNFILYASHKGWTKLYTGNEDKSTFLAKRENRCIIVYKKESKSIDETPKESVDKQKKKRENKRKPKNEKEKVIANYAPDNSENESISVDKFLDKKIDNIFIKFDYMLSNNIIDQDTYDCLISNKCRILQHLLIEFKKDPSLKKWKQLSGNVWKCITMLTQYAIKKKWISKSGNN